MQRSYLVKSPVHFADFGFFVKVGDILVHDTSNANKLTVYRNGEVVKAVKQTSLGIAAMVKNSFIVEVTGQASASKTAPKAPQKPIVAPPKPAPAPEPKTAPKAPKTNGFTAEEWKDKKKDKAQPKEVSVESLPPHLQELAKKPKPKMVDLDIEETEI